MGKGKSPNANISFSLCPVCINALRLSTENPRKGVSRENFMEEDIKEDGSGVMFGRGERFDRQGKSEQMINIDEGALIFRYKYVRCEM